MILPTPTFVKSPFCELSYKISTVISMKRWSILHFYQSISNTFQFVCDNEINFFSSATVAQIFTLENRHSFWSSGFWINGKWDKLILGLTSVLEKRFPGALLFKSRYAWSTNTSSNTVAIQWLIGLRSEVCSNVKPPSEAQLQIKSHEILFIHNTHFCCPIIWKVCTDQGSNTAVLCAKFSND